MRLLLLTTVPSSNHSCILHYIIVMAYVTTSPTQNPYHSKTPLKEITPLLLNIIIVFIASIINTQQTTVVNNQHLGSSLQESSVLSKKIRQWRLLKATHLYTSSKEPDLPQEKRSKNCLSTLPGME